MEGKAEAFRDLFFTFDGVSRSHQLVGVAEGTFDYWAGEVKRAVGRELSRCKLFPPSKYFQS